MKKLLLLSLCIAFLGAEVYAQQQKQATNEEHLFPIKLGRKWGYINVKGDLIIDTVFQAAEEFNEGIAVAQIAGRNVFIDKTGKHIYGPGDYTSVGIFSDGLALVNEVEGDRYYIDRQGNIAFYVSDSVFDSGPFKEGLSMITVVTDRKAAYNKPNTLQKFKYQAVDYRFGFMNKDGDIVIEEKFEYADSFKNNMARVKYRGKYGYIDKKGSFVVKAKYDYINEFVDGIALFEKAGKKGYVNDKGKEIIKAQYDFAQNFSEGLAGVMVEGKFGYIDTKGKLVIEAKYDFVQPFSEGRAPYELKDKWGLIDRTGKVIIQPLFDFILGFKDKRCPVLYHGRWGYLGERNVIAISPAFDKAGYFEHGLAIVEYNNITFYINKDGDVIPPFRASR